MGLFDQVDNSADTVEEKDFVRGQKRELIKSSIQNLIIKYCYGAKTKNGALGVHTLFEVADGEYKGKQIRTSEYITSGSAKGCKTFYERKTDAGMEKRKLPGFVITDSLARLVVHKGIMQCGTELKTIKLYDYDAKAEVPKEVEMFVELVNKGVCGCILHRIEDKTAKNTQTGTYDPTGKTYELNVIDKFLDAVNRKTVSEITHDIPADFKDKWIKKWEGQVDDQSTTVTTTGVQGAPTAQGNSSSKANLFQ